MTLLHVSSHAFPFGPLYSSPWEPPETAVPRQIDGMAVLLRSITALRLRLILRIHLLYPLLVNSPSIILMIARCCQVSPAVLSIAVVRSMYYCFVILLVSYGQKALTEYLHQTFDLETCALRGAENSSVLGGRTSKPCGTRD